MIMNVENNQECFVQLWRKLERTRRLLGGQYKRFCIRNVLKVWFGYEATDDFIWEVCHKALVDDEPQRVNIPASIVNCCVPSSPSGRASAITR